MTMNAVLAPCSVFNLGDRRSRKNNNIPKRSERMMNGGLPSAYGGAAVAVSGYVGRQYARETDGHSPSLARRDRAPHAMPSGFESDDSNKSAQTVVEGEARLGGGGSEENTGGVREWRRWAGRGPLVRRALHARPSAPERLHRPLQLKFPPPNLLNGSKWDPLTQDIWEQFVASQQTEETFRKKMSLWKLLYLSIKSLFPRYALYLVGSTMTGFGLDSSDMDLCLYVRPLEPVDPRHHAMLHLSFLLHFMKSFDSPLLSGLDLIQAKVPILKFRDEAHGIRVDLNCNNTVGIRNSNLLFGYSQQDWRVRPLVLMAKLWAQANRINDARRCTLSSYSLTLMVLHYLQCGVSPAVLPCLRVSRAAWDARPPAPLPPPPPPPPHPHHNTLSLGELFLGFLQYYATFQFDKMAVSVRAGRCVPIAECRAADAPKNNPHQWKLLCIEEPFELTNTACSVYDPETFGLIVRVFRASHATLARSLRLGDVLPLAPSGRAR